MITLDQSEASLIQTDRGSQPAQLRLTSLSGLKRSCGEACGSLVTACLIAVTAGEACEQDAMSGTMSDISGMTFNYMQHDKYMSLMKLYC